MKNKTIATLLAACLGATGAPWFYLYGSKNKWGWLQLACFPLAIYAGFIEALVFGLTSDEDWDKKHNQGQAYSKSGWPHVLILIATLMIGTIVTLTSIIVAILFLTGARIGVSTF